MVEGGSARGLWDVVIDLNSITSRHPFCRLCVPKERYIFFDVEQRASVSNYKTAAASLPHRRRVFRLSGGHQRVWAGGRERSARWKIQILLVDQLGAGKRRGFSTARYTRVCHFIYRGLK